MLASIGMTPKKLRRMLYTECWIYGFASLLLGVPLSMLASYGIGMVVQDLSADSLRIPWEYLLIAAVSVFLVVFSSMLYAYARLKKDDPVQTLRNENT